MIDKQKLRLLRSAWRPVRVFGTVNQFSTFLSTIPLGRKFLCDTTLSQTVLDHFINCCCSKSLDSLDSITEFISSKIVSFRVELPVLFALNNFLARNLNGRKVLRKLQDTMRRCAHIIIIVISHLHIDSSNYRSFLSHFVEYARTYSPISQRQRVPSSICTFHLHFWLIHPSQNSGPKTFGFIFFQALTQ